MESTQTIGENKEWLNGAGIRPATVEDLFWFPSMFFLEFCTHSKSSTSTASIKFYQKIDKSYNKIQIMNLGGNPMS